MVDTVTKNYGWTKPSVGGDQSVWGGLLNGDLDLIDAQVFANQQAGTVIGQIAMFAGATPPANWLWCNGAVYNNSDIPLLAPILANRFPGGDGTSTSAVPNLFGRTPVGYDGAGWTLGAMGGEQNHTLGLGELPVHSHGVSDPGHAHGLSDPGHNHNLVDPGHAHWASYELPVAGAGVASGSGYTVGGAATSTVRTGVFSQAALANIGVAAAATGLAIQNAGAGSAHNNMQPYTVVGFIIRFK